MTVSPQTSIPIVDLTAYSSSTSSQRQLIAHDLAHACTSVGFVYIAGHGIPAELTQAAFAWSKRFFDLPAQDKMKAPHPDGPSVHRGYSHPGLEKVSQETGPDDEVGSRAKKLREVEDFKASIAALFVSFGLPPSSPSFPSSSPLLPFFSSPNPPLKPAPTPGKLRNRRRAQQRTAEHLAAGAHPPGLPCLHDGLLLGISSDCAAGAARASTRDRARRGGDGEAAAPAFRAQQSAALAALSARGGGRGAGRESGANAGAFGLEVCVILNPL